MMTGEKKEEKKKCKYAWEDYKCSREALRDDEHCFFHSKDIEGKEKIFDAAFWKEFKRQKEQEEIYDFTGFVFPSAIIFDEFEKVEKDVIFTEAQFSGGILCLKAQFHGEAHFEYTQFSGHALFGEAQFHGEAHFEHAKFFGDTYFDYVRFFGKAYFDYVRFSGTANFAPAKFYKEASFDEAQFSKEAWFGENQFFENASFRKTQFSGVAEFMDAHFSGNTYFQDSQFCGKADFSQFSGEAIYFCFAQFHGEAFFQEAKFSGYTSFGYAQFSGEANFEHAQFSGEANFEHGQFSGRVNFYRSNFSGEKLLGLFTSLRNSGIKSILRGRYKIRDLRFHLSEEIAKEYPVIDRMTKDAWYLDDFKTNHPVIYWIWWFFADCGRSIFRWALWSLGIAIAFAFIYYSFYTDYMLNFQTVYVSEEFPLFSFIYYSIVTFTTLGFGDIVPRTGWLQFWVMLEVILGYIMLGGLISILANKLARRS
jgi:uncharacterized protein YjbI with pentapeptide repeats